VPAPPVAQFLLIAVLAATGCAKRYRVEGLVLRVDPAQGTLTVSHREIPGYMPAMAMPFRAAPGEPLDTLHPGSRVEFELRAGRGGARARSIRVTQANLIDGARLDDPPEKLVIGDLVPDFELIDQQGRATRLAGFGGKLVAVNFIYTRCPLPEVCPRLSASFAALQRRFRDRMPDKLALLSVTLDPGYDTPAVLERYAESIGARWRFLTGDQSRIDAVARRFGLLHWPEEGVIVHTSVTALIGPDRRLKALVEGSTYRLEQLCDLIEHLLEGNK
jgi:protein SCO1/2